jgi:outer membrane protein TolC
MRRWLVVVLLCLLGGCGRAWYRRDADRETYRVLEERETDPQWDVPYFWLNPNPTSRLYDPYNPDFPPMPPDDPAAYQYMLRVNGMRNYRRWHKDGDAPSVEDPAWRSYLPLDDKGVLVLTQERAVELGWLNSRDYQTALETVYQQALTLTFVRFNFALHWFGMNATTFTGAGDGDTAIHTLTTSSSVGFNRLLAAGGQLLVDYANSFVFNFNGSGSTFMTSNLTFNLIQPLLRGFGRRVVLEQLTQSERTVLYAVRDFARFRKQLYVNFTTGFGGFLSLRNQGQSIRNQEANLANQERNYEFALAQNRAGFVPDTNVDQAVLGVQNARAALVQAGASLETNLDTYKTTLGLPPEIPVRLDDQLLAPFQLTNADLNKLNDEMDPFLRKYLFPDQAPPLADLQEGFNKLKEYLTLAQKVLGEVQGELEKWKKQPIESKESKEQADLIRSFQDRVDKDLTGLPEDMEALSKAIDKSKANLKEINRDQSWKDLVGLIRKQKVLVAALYVLQTRIRVFLIQLTPVNIKLNDAVAYARAHRLDLMNQQARVIDAWRQIYVTANALKSDFTLTGTANLMTPPLSLNPVGFSPTANSYSVGVQFNAPLNRLAERNNYRQSLINYQLSRRIYMSLDDTIQRQIRADLRRLESDRLSFEISRVSLVAAARAVDSAEETLRLPPDNPAAGNAAANSLTVLKAYDDLLTAKNTLIGFWVSYETDRVQLLLDMEALQLDEREVPENDANDQSADFLTAPRELPVAGADATGLAKPDGNGVADPDANRALHRQAVP